MNSRANRVQHARCLTKSVAGESAIKRRRLEMLAGVQRISEIECVVAARYSYLLVRSLLDREFPRTAPPQRTEPDSAVLLIRVCAIRLGCIDRKPWIGLMARGAAPALSSTFTPGWISSWTICVSPAHRFPFK